jgi:Gluconate 2-dehydrogenase subunit 3
MTIFISKKGIGLLYFVSYLRQQKLFKKMQRRNLLKQLGLLVGGSVVLPSAMFAESGDVLFSDQLDYSKVKLFNKKQRKIVIALAEAIIPRTTSPGATDAKVGPFIELMLADCYENKHQIAFIEGLAAVELRSMTDHKLSFLKLSGTQMTDILTKTEAEAKMEKQKRTIAKTKDAPEIFWFLLKSLTLTGFFTSEPGGTQAANYMMNPGRYNGAEKMTAQTRVWL